jgi:chemotaxis protein MotB
VRRDDSNSQGGKWLTTFNDMVTLLLTFFVLVLSMSKLDSGKVQQASRSVSDAFGMLNWSKNLSVKVFDPFVLPRGVKIIRSQNMKERLTDDFNQIKGVEADITRDGVLVTLRDKILFETGLAQLNVKETGIIRELGGILSNVDCPIRVEGHTDDIPIHNSKFISNWELSAARAVAVVKYLTGECGIPPERLSAAGYAESRPLVPNDSKQNRAINRRVEIILTMKE